MGSAPLNFAWVFSGAFFGIFMSGVVQIWLGKTGDYKYYDRTCKVLLFIGIVGNLLLGTLVQCQVESFTPVNNILI